jgi:hypothetical protein
MALRSSGPNTSRRPKALSPGKILRTSASFTTTASRLRNSGLAAVYSLDTAKPAILVHYPAISMNWHVLAFTVVVTLATSLMFGVVPALSTAGIQIRDALKSASLTHSAGRGATRLRKILWSRVLGRMHVTRLATCAAIRFWL